MGTLTCIQDLRKILFAFAAANKITSLNKRQTFPVVFDEDIRVAKGLKIGKFPETFRQFPKNPGKFPKIRESFLKLCNPTLNYIESSLEKLPRLYGFKCYL